MSAHTALILLPVPAEQSIWRAMVLSLVLVVLMFV